MERGKSGGGTRDPGPHSHADQLLAGPVLLNRGDQARAAEQAASGLYILPTIPVATSTTQDTAGLLLVFESSDPVDMRPTARLAGSAIVTGDGRTGSWSG